MRFLSVGVLLCSALVCSTGGDKSFPEFVRTQHKKQFAGISFAVPVAGLLNQNGNQNINIFGKSTVTRTVISTVSTVMVPSYRTCIVTPAMFAPCAGRRRRAAEDEAEQYDPNAAPSMIVQIGKTRISDPGLVAQILHLDKSYASDFSNNANPDPSPSEAQTLLYPSDDTTIQSSALRAEEVTTVAPTVVLEDETTTVAEVEEEDEEEETDEEDPARAGLRAATTVTTTIPVTAVLSTPVTVAMSTLTISYMGCSPPGRLPVSTSACMP